MDPRQILAMLQAGQPVGHLSHAELYSARAVAPQQWQAILGPLEHQAFAREWTQANPWVAAPSLLAAIPAYTLAKSMGLLNTRSPASLDEMASGYRGMYQGLLSNAQ